MNATVISFLVPTNMIVGIAMASCVLLAVFMVISDDDKAPILIRLSRNVTTFVFPLMLVFVFLFIVWVAHVFVS